MFKAIKPKTIKLDIDPDNVKESLKIILSELSEVRLRAERVLINLPTLELKFKDDK